MKGRKSLALIIAVGLALLIRIFSYFPDAVERYYSTGIYPYIASMQRILFGWIPFSVGDFFYAAVVIWLLFRAFRFTKNMLQKGSRKREWLRGAMWVIRFSLWVYVLFNLLWGMNYNRRPMAQMVGLTPGIYSVEELHQLVNELVTKLNSLDSSALPYRAALLHKPELFKASATSYAAISDQYTFLHYDYPSVKPSIYSIAGNYLGFSGYYNPFSGEAQVNTTIPPFLRPFVTCHEIGHQLGFAKENEANFAGFLSSREAPNPAFRYSVYFDMYSYALNELFLKDSVKARIAHQQLGKQVQKDYTDLRSFFEKYTNPLEPVIRNIYGEYLKANDQPGGLKSYNQVVAMLVAYQRKYKKV